MTPFESSVLSVAQQMQSCITALTAVAGSPHHEAILIALSCPGSVLARVYLARPSSAAVCTLSSLKALQQCVLDGPGIMYQFPLDISALQMLPVLERLCLLNGCYEEVPASSQLTNYVPWAAN